MLHSRYLESRCKKPAYLHQMKEVKKTITGLLERCARCGFALKVPNGMPDREYIRYHVRDILKPNDPQFQREYTNT